ncbi:MAG: conjugal transfer protein TrbN [Burkholderiaceae bacterium]|nr:conjugal transfer protein TrbN [Burkholderiaceae bacterium]
MDMTPALQERISCSLAAAAKYQVPAAMLLAVADKEGGRPGLVVRNKNGTSDIGTMQFNSAYVATLAPYGIRAAHVALAGCYPFELAAWRLRDHLANDTGDVWTRAANYHSRTPQYNSVYRADLIVKARQWNAWLTPRLQPGQTTQFNQRQPANVGYITPASSAARWNAVISTSPSSYVQRSIVAAPANGIESEGVRP